MRRSPPKFTANDIQCPDLPGPNADFKSSASAIVVAVCSTRARAALERYRRAQPRVRFH